MRMAGEMMRRGSRMKEMMMMTRAGFFLKKIKSKVPVQCKLKRSLPEYMKCIPVQLILSGSEQGGAG